MCVDDMCVCGVGGVACNSRQHNKLKNKTKIASNRGESQPEPNFARNRNLRNEFRICVFFFCV